MAVDVICCSSVFGGPVFVEQTQCHHPMWMPSCPVSLSVITSQISAASGVCECQPQSFWTPGIRKWEKKSVCASTWAMLWNCRFSAAVVWGISQPILSLEGKALHPFYCGSDRSRNKGIQCISMYLQLEFHEDCGRSWFGYLRVM